MNELKERLGSDLAHVQTVYFDRDGKWYLRKSTVTVSEMSREEILNEGAISDESNVNPQGNNHKRNRR